MLNVHPSHLILMLRAYAAMAGLATMTLVGFVVWIKSLRRARLVEDLGTSTVRAVAQGYVELVGRQYPVAGSVLAAPLTGSPCTWWHYKIEEKRRSWADGGRRKDWVVIEEATSPDLILFKDATGQLVVDPKGAEVEPSMTARWYSRELPAVRPMIAGKLRDGRYRYTEKRMHAGDRMYVAGELRTFSGHQEADAYGHAIADLLGRWKQDQHDLLERFDADRDGRIDVVEWDAARAAASTEVSARLQTHATQQQAEVLRRPADGQPFLVSAKPQRELADRLRSEANTGLIIFALFGGMLVWLIHLVLAAA